MRGARVPAEIVVDLGLVKTLPAPARQQLLRVLGPCLAEPVPNVESQLDRFCSEFGVRRPELARALKACRFLLRQAAVTNLTEAEFVEDLAVLGDTGEIAESLLSGYETAVKLVRLEIKLGAVADHGKVVERVSWRVDHIGESSRGDKVGVPVLVLTLSYLEGGRRDRITLQLGPDTVKELRAMCDRLL